MRHTFPLAILIAFALTALSCNDDAHKKALEDRKNEGNFFANDTASIDLENLKNEMASSPTGFLRSFQTDDIPWQKWNHDLLQKAKSAQKPIIILVGTSIGGHSRNLSAEISANPELRKLFSESAVCSVVDTRAHPEMSLLMEKLLREIRRSAQFPSLMWITHEGSPLSSLPIGNLTGEALAVTLTSAIEQVNDTWLNASEYAIEHSRDNNISPQLALQLW